MAPPSSNTSDIVDPNIGSMASSAPWSGISLEPPEAWVEPETYESTLAAKEGAHITHLLWARQMNAESETAFHTTAMRLETSLAVQHQSQWHVDFNPRAQHLTLHWLRVVR